MADGRTEHLRTPPMAIEAEQNVLGGLLLVPAAFDRIADVVSEQSFYRRDHALIFRAIKALHDADRPFDALTLGEWLCKRGYGEQIQDGAYLIELTNTQSSAANIRAHAEIIADKHRLRRMIDVGSELVNNAFLPGGRDTVEILGNAQIALSDLLTTEPCELESIAPVIERCIDGVFERSNHDGEITGLPTGVEELDLLINGLDPGQVIVIAARPKMGKTTLAQNIAEFLAIGRKTAVAVFSFEMQPEELGNRMLSSIGHVNGDNIRRGRLDSQDHANIGAARKKLSGAQIFISRPKSARIEQVVAQAKRQHAKTPLGLIVIDYLQLMESSAENRTQGISQITRALKLLAGELRVPIILLSQLNRELEKRPDKRPLLSDLRDSGTIEQDADVVIAIYRDEIYNKASQYAGTAELIVLAQRNGPPGTVRVKYEPHQFRFSNLPSSWRPAPKETKAKGSTFDDMVSRCQPGDDA